MKNTILPGLVLLLITGAPAIAATRLVPDEYVTIQAAIDDCNDGDVVIVAEGTYYENINFNGENITLTSTNPEDPNKVRATTIDANSVGSVVTFAGTETTNSLLTGFTITGGHSSYLGGGIRGHGTNAKITRCIITGNTADDSGGGVNYCKGIISHCIITNNHANDYGGGLNRFDGTVTNCLISHNSAMYGGAIGASGQTINCTIAHNTATKAGGGLYHNYGGGITNCIVWDNSPDQISRPTYPTTYSCVQGGASGTGNIDTMPQFVDPYNDDYRLQSASPCIDAGTGTWPDHLPRTDIDGNFRQIDGNKDGTVTVDMGAYEYGIVETALISAQPAQIEFIAPQGGPNPDSQSLFVFNIGLDTLTWQMTEHCPWLDVSPRSGSSTGEIDEVVLTIDVTDLVPGRYSCDLVVSDDAASNSPVIVPATLIVHAQGRLRVPSEFLTIQAAIDAANSGDTVIVDDGIYAGPGNRDIDFHGKAITVRSKNGPDNCIIDCQNSGRGFHFRTVQDANSILDGFTITNGSAGSRPGGIYCGDSGPTILNCMIRNNNGGGISCEKGNLTIRDCILSQNFGGSAILAACGSLTISNCIISDNRAQYGGGIHCYGYKCTCKVTITNCIVTRNIAVHGGGIHLDSIRGHVELTNCTISNNDGGGIYCIDSWHPVIANCTVIHNTSRDGGGIYFTHTSSPTMTNCTLADNLASSGSAICCDVSRPIITKCIIWGNGPLKSPVIYLRDRSNAEVRYCDVQGSQEEVYIDSSSVLNWGVGNIDADPGFAQLGYWDVNDTHRDFSDDFWVDGDYHLKSQAGRWEPDIQAWVQDDLTSPCIDAGDMASPIGLEPFPNGGIINMGAYGGTPEASKSYFGSPLCKTIVAGDINGDCKIDYLDFCIMAFHWLQEH